MFESDILRWAVTVAASVAVALTVHILIFKVIARLSRRSTTTQTLIVRARQPARLFVAVFTAFGATVAAPLDSRIASILSHALLLLVVGAAGWLIVRIGHVFLDVTAERQELDTRDNLHARRRRTQVVVFRKIFTVFIGVLTMAAMLMTFPQVRAVGASIFASAGILGIVAGIAAGPTLGNLIAGIQIAFTEPIRIDDVVVVEEEWGRIEEITLTYVVVRLWDQRRLVLPISYFVNQPFQNWTRSTADVIGSVYLYADHRVPVDELRAEFHRLLSTNPAWNGQTAAMQVTDVTERTVQLRAIMSAPDASAAWDLRCDLREGLVSYLQKVHPESLPRTRAEIDQFVPV